MNQRQVSNKRQNTFPGFTLIELMLAMSFISVLLITIALSIIQLGTIYNRGMALKEINQSSRDISDDLRRTLETSGVFSINADGSDSSDRVTVRHGSEVVGGRLCLGAYSYVWNYQYAQDNNLPGLTRIGVDGDPVDFVKVPDVGRQFCAKSGSGLLRENLSTADATRLTELLSSGDRELGIQRFSVSSQPTAEDPVTGKKLYTFTYTLGTGDTIAMNSDQSACLEPDQPNANLTYCNVQTFTIALTAGNGVN